MKKITLSKYKKDGVVYISKILDTHIELLIKSYNKTIYRRFIPNTEEFVKFAIKWTDGE